MLSSLVKEHQAKQASRKEELGRIIKKIIYFPQDLKLNFCHVFRTKSEGSGGCFQRIDSSARGSFECWVGFCLFLKISPEFFVFKFCLKYLFDSCSVAQAYLNQKRLDAEAKQLHASATSFAKQTQQWMNLIEGFSSALKVSQLILIEVD